MNGLMELLLLKQLNNQSCSNNSSEIRVLEEKIRVLERQIDVLERMLRLKNSGNNNQMSSEFLLDFLDNT